MNQKPFADLTDSIHVDMLVSFEMNRSFMYPSLIALRMWLSSSNFDKVPQDQKPLKIEHTDCHDKVSSNELVIMTGPSDF